MLTGYKTYLVAAVAVLAAILGYLTDQLTLLEALQAVGLAIGLGGNRALLRAAAVLNSPYSQIMANPDPTKRALTTYVGVALTVLTAVLAYLNQQQDIAVTVAAILGALGLTFLGTGMKKVADGNPL